MAAAGLLAGSPCWWTLPQANSCAKNKIPSPLFADGGADLGDGFLGVRHKPPARRQINILLIKKPRRVQLLQSLQALRHAETSQWVVRVEQKCFLKAFPRRVILIEREISFADVNIVLGLALGFATVVLMGADALDWFLTLLGVGAAVEDFQVCAVVLISLAEQIEFLLGDS